jgi:hypothetical protein
MAATNVRSHQSAGLRYRPRSPALIDFPDDGPDRCGRGPERSKPSRHKINWFLWITIDTPYVSMFVFKDLPAAHGRPLSRDHPARDARLFGWRIAERHDPGAPHPA